MVNLSNNSVLASLALQVVASGVREVVGCTAIILCVIQAAMREAEIKYTVAMMEGSIIEVLY
jgi:hypothetical protein